VIVVDVFDGARMPDSVAGVDFAAAAGRLLRPGGLVGINLTDLPPLAHSRIQVATLRAVFADVGLIAGVGMLRGRRAGNVVLVAGRTAGDLPGTASGGGCRTRPGAGPVAARHGPRHVRRRRSCPPRHADLNDLR
jgi:hypothetical protein